MNKFKVLVEGYAREGDKKNNYFASPTCSLIESNGVTVLVDPGADKPKLLDAFKREGIKYEDIDIIFLTHWHPDHFLNIRMFPDHDIMDAFTIWKDTGEEIFPNVDKNITHIPGTSIEIIETPGHREEHVSLLVETCEGKVCIAQDVFWWEDGQQLEKPTYEELINYDDPFVDDFDQLKESRKKILEIADLIIPGHGRAFVNEFKGKK